MIIEGKFGTYSVRWGKYGFRWGKPLIRKSKFKCFGKHVCLFSSVSEWGPELKLETISDMDETTIVNWFTRAVDSYEEDQRIELSLKRSHAYKYKAWQ